MQNWNFNSRRAVQVQWTQNSPWNKRRYSSSPGRSPLPNAAAKAIECVSLNWTLRFGVKRVEGSSVLKGERFASRESSEARQLITFLPVYVDFAWVGLQMAPDREIVESFLLESDAWEYFLAKGGFKVDVMLNSSVKSPYCLYKFFACAEALCDNWRIARLCLFWRGYPEISWRNSSRPHLISNG